MSDRITEIRKRYAHWQAYYSMLHTEHRQATDDIGYLLDLLNKRDRDIEEFTSFHERYTEDISKESVALKTKLECQENTIAEQHVLILELQGEIRRLQSAIINECDSCACGIANERDRLVREIEYLKNELDIIDAANTALHGALEEAKSEGV